MVKTYFTLAGIGALTGMVWMGGGCSSDEVTTNPGDAGGGGTSGNPKGDGSTTPPDNDSGSSGDIDSGGSSGANPTTPITYGKCPNFTKCAGGDVKGSWKVTGGCLGEDQFAAAKAKCPDLVESDVVIKGDGTVNIDLTNVKRDTTVKVTGKVLIPKSCASIAPDCATVGTGLEIGFGGLKFDKAVCAEKGTNCDCTVESTVSEKTDDPYTVDGTGVLTTTGAAPRTYDYCITNITKNTYKETTAGATTLKMTVELTKQ